MYEALLGTDKTALEWHGTFFDISDDEQKAQAAELLPELLKELPATSLNSAVSDICRRLDVDPDQGLKAGSAYGMLRAEAIQVMSKSHLIEFGAHTDTHAILSVLSPEEQRREIETSVERVKDLTGRSCTLFAYPNGRSQDYDQHSIDLLRDAGIKAAVTTIAAPNTSATPPLELRRYVIGPDIDLATFKLKVHHFLYYYQMIASGRGS